MGGEVAGTFVRSYLEEPRNMQYTDFGHNFNVSEEEQLLLVVPVKGRLSPQLPKGNCVQARSSFYLGTMNLSNPKFRYKGSKPFWLWTTGEWLFYTSLMIIGWVIIILNDL